MATFDVDVDVHGKVVVTRPWSDWLFLGQQRDIEGNGGFHIHNPWADSTQPEGAADRNRLEIGYRTAGGQDLWEQLVIHGPTGNVGIGTGSPQDKLHVAGTVRANDLVVTSDIRLKAAIRPIAGAKRKIEQLRGVEFEWRDSDGSTRGWGAGFVAQEVEAVAPELVHDNGAERYKGVNLGGMLGTLVEAFKELAAENGALRSRVEALERQRPLGRWMERIRRLSRFASATSGRPARSTSAASRRLRTFARNPFRGARTSPTPASD